MFYIEWWTMVQLNRVNLLLDTLVQCMVSLSTQTDLCCCRAPRMGLSDFGRCSPGLAWLFTKVTQHRVFKVGDRVSYRIFKKERVPNWGSNYVNFCYMYHFCIQFQSFLLVSKNRLLPSNQTPTERIETVSIYLYNCGCLWVLPSVTKCFSLKSSTLRKEQMKAMWSIA